MFADEVIMFPVYKFHILQKPVLSPLQAVFLYFIINVLWVVATFFLQAIGSDVLSIKIPKYFPNGTLSDEPLKVEPLSLMFLLSFAVLLIVQFLAMLYHRYHQNDNILTAVICILINFESFKVLHSIRQI